MGSLGVYLEILEQRKSYHTPCGRPPLITFPSTSITERHEIYLYIRHHAPNASSLSPSEHKHSNDQRSQNSY